MMFSNQILYHIQNICICLITIHSISKLLNISIYAFQEIVLNEILFHKYMYKFHCHNEHQLYANAIRV